MQNRMLLFLLVFAFISSCSVPQYQQQSLPEQKGINLANLYNPKATTIYPKFVAYNVNDSQTTVYTYLYLPQLAFRPQGNARYAKILLNFKLTPSFTNRTIIDTLTKIFVLRQSTSTSSIVFPITLPPVDDSLYLLNVYIKDLWRNRSNVAFIPIDKRTANSPTNFLVRYASTLKPVFDPYIDSSQKYVISHNSGIDSLWLFHYPLDSLPPKPPFYLGARTRKIFADTVYKIPTNQGIKLKQRGIYVFKAVRTQPSGKMLVYFYDDYPLINRASLMIRPLQYITTTREYKKLANAYSPKMAVDSFWLSIANNPQQARQLIKAYYNRVFLANVYFTDFREGWQTDRGMIYIMFGLPQVVYKLDDREEWYYYDYQKGVYVKFVFRWQKHKFCTNYYVLVPDVKYQSYWKQAVSQWRSGTIPSL